MMKVIKTEVVLQRGCCDSICLTVDMPSPYLCDEDTDVKLCLAFNSSPNCGIEYVRKNFGIEPVVYKVS